MLKFNGENVVKGRFPNNEIDYEPWSFSPFPMCLSTDSWNSFTLIFESNEDLFNLQIVKKMYDDRYIGNAKTRLSIHYFPYCQMDRPMDSHGFSLKYVTQIINELKFDMVEVFDPHSNVLPALGCGLGGLKWEEVKEKILSILSELDNNINIEIYEPF